MARFGVGLAVDHDVVKAAEAATRDALAPLGQRTPDLLCAFISSSEPDAVTDAAERISEISGAHSILGCTAGGVIGHGRAVEGETAVSVWVAVLPKTVVRTFHLEVMRTDDGLAVVGLPERQDDDQVGILLADPYSFPAEGFVERLNDSMLALPVAGGLASGHLGPGSTRLLIDGRVVERGAVGALLSGPVSVLPMVSQGCRPVGPPMTVTAADHNMLLELAGAPAVTKLEQVLRGLPPEEQALASRGLHIGIAMDEYADDHETGDFLIRGVLGIDNARKSIAVGDVVPVGRTVRFQVRDASAADADLQDQLERLRRATLNDPVEGALLFSCNGRGANLFPTADHDVLAVHEHLAVVPTAGFFAAGEIGPVGGRNHLHGFTASMLAFGVGT
jgi:small ligand-binding sensory domain FIST